MRSPVPLALNYLHTGREFLGHRVGSYLCPVFFPPPGNSPEAPSVTTKNPLWMLRNRLAFSLTPGKSDLPSSTCCHLGLAR